MSAPLSRLLLLVIPADGLEVPSATHFLQDKAGRPLLGLQEGTVRVGLGPQPTQSQFKVERVDTITDHVAFVNAAGYYLTALSDQVDWLVKAPNMEEMFSPETHGEFQAFKSHNGKYLNINEDGLLDIVSAVSIGDSQLFKKEGITGLHLSLSTPTRYVSDMTHCRLFWRV